MFTNFPKLVACAVAAVLMTGFMYWSFDTSAKMAKVGGSTSAAAVQVASVAASALVR
jgi:hypothetical protein